MIKKKDIKLVVSLIKSIPALFLLWCLFQIFIGVGGGYGIFNILKVVVPFFIICFVLFFLINFFYKVFKFYSWVRKYDSVRMAYRLFSKIIWQGESKEQLLASLGRPDDIDQKVYKSKIKEIWKYNPTGNDSYKLRVILENEIVVGWSTR